MKKIVFILAVAGLIAAIGLLGRAFLLSDKQAEVKIASYREELPKISAKSVKERAAEIVKQPQSDWARGLKLRGVFFRDSSQSIAVIEDSVEKRMGHYKVGDMIRGAIVVKIFSAKAELLKDGRREVLSLIDAEKGTALSDEQDFVRVVSETERIVNKDILSRKMGNIGEIISEIKITPVIKAGRIDGFRANGIKENGIVSRAGIKNNDIIKRVNGQKIDSVSQAFEVYKEIRNQSVIKVEIERSNRPTTLTYRMD